MILLTINSIWDLPEVLCAQCLLVCIERTVVSTCAVQITSVHVCVCVGGGGSGGVGEGCVYGMEGALTLPGGS